MIILAGGGRVVRRETPFYFTLSGREPSREPKDEAAARGGRAEVGKRRNRAEEGEEEEEGEGRTVLNSQALNSRQLLRGGNTKKEKGEGGETELRKRGT